VLVSGAEVVFSSGKAAGAKAFCARYRKERLPKPVPAVVDLVPRALALVVLFDGEFRLALCLEYGSR
jgi:hypothetical protein